MRPQNSGSSQKIIIQMGVIKVFLKRGIPSRNKIIRVENL